MSRNFGNLNILEPSGNVQACSAYLYYCILAVQSKPAVPMLSRQPARQKKNCAGVTFLISVRLIHTPVLLAALILRDLRFSKECYGRCSWNMTLCRWGLQFVMFWRIVVPAYLGSNTPFPFLKEVRRSKTSVTIYQSIWRLTFQNSRIFSGTGVGTSDLAR